MAPRSAPKRARGSTKQLVRRQHGVISRSQLVEIGLSAEAIKHRLRTGRLVELHRSVYAVGQLEVSRYGRWMAAVLACGDGAVLSHGSAGVLWRIVNRERGVIEISVPRTNATRRPGLRIHRPTCRCSKDLATIQGIPVTSPTRTLIDLANYLPPDRLERAVSEAGILGLIELDELRAELDGRPGQRGVRPLRNLIDRHTFALTRTELERRFLPLARRAGLPLPETGARVNGFEVDFFFRGLGLVVETDGGQFHRSAMKQTRDRNREHAHIDAGLLPVRFTHRQVRHDPAHVVKTLRSAARRCAAMAQSA